MDTKVLLGQLAAGVDLGAYIFYFYSIVSGKNQPNRASWIIWTVIKAFILVGGYSDGARNTLWLPLAQMIGNGTIMIMAFRYGVGDWKKLDKWCLGLAALSVIPLAFKMPMLNLIIIMFVELLGTIPTFGKLLLREGEENLTAWVMINAACVFSVFSAEKWEFGLLLYPVYLVTLNSPILALVIRNRKGGRKCEH